MIGCSCFEISTIDLTLLPSSTKLGKYVVILTTKIVVFPSSLKVSLKWSTPTLAIFSNVVTSSPFLSYIPQIASIIFMWSAWWWKILVFSSLHYRHSARLFSLHSTYLSTNNFLFFCSSCPIVFLASTSWNPTKCWQNSRSSCVSTSTNSFASFFYFHESIVKSPLWPFSIGCKLKTSKGILNTI